jgi:twitching motility protein PilI
MQTVMQNQSAIELLSGLAAAAKAYAAPLPSGPAAEPVWQGMGFQVGGVRLVAPLDDIGEVISLPRITGVPRVRDWLLGIANVRGRLVPIVDLHLYLAMPPTQSVSRWRVLVVEDGDLVAGLLVEQLLGMQYFGERASEPVPSDQLGRLGRYVCRTFRQGGRIYHEARLHSILRDERFLSVAETPGQAESREMQGNAGI